RVIHKVMHLHIVSINPILIRKTLMLRYCGYIWLKMDIKKAQLTRLGFLKGNRVCASVPEP
ncbi:hypothetical protein EKE90_21375, partial [Escherichia coli]|nr:hypothetical protein [Escherichia coli]